MDEKLPAHIRAHERSAYHRDEVLGSSLCGCFNCLATFPPDQVSQWVDEDDAGVGQTAICPECALDTVLGAGSGYPLTPEFLGQMQRYWCGEQDAAEDGEE